MALEAIEQFELPLLADDAYLFLWRVASQMEEAYSVVKAWGFEAKSELIWLKCTTNGKRHFGMGWHVRAEHEGCILAVRGRPKPRIRDVRTTFEAVVQKHSAKPDEFYQIVERLCAGPYVELFARRQRAGCERCGTGAVNQQSGFARAMSQA